MMWTASIGYILQGTQEEWSLNDVEIGLIGSCFSAGLMLGAFVWGVVGDRYGRMHAFKNTVILASAAALCLLFSLDYSMVCVSLLFLGMGMGGELALGGTVFCEFCPPSKMYYLTIMAIFWGAGGTYTALAAFIVSLSNTTAIYNWRFIVGACCVVEFMCLGFRFFMKETPEYCMQKGQIEKAEKILDFISRQNSGKEYRIETNGSAQETGGEINRDEKIMKSSTVQLICKLFIGKTRKISLLFALVNPN